MILATTTLSSFLLTTVAISLSGVLAPGPITAATLASGSRNRHAGILVGLGHVAVELPLILLLAAGLGTVLKAQAFRMVISLAGGGLLVLMGVQLLVSLRRGQTAEKASLQRHPFWIGLALSGANPYFLLWWATVGLTMTSQAMDLGLLVLALFALVHWLCDFVWLEILSQAGFKGSQLCGRRSQAAISLVCAIVLIAFGAKFLLNF